MAFAANTQSCGIFLWKTFQKLFQKYFWKLLYSILEKKTFESTSTWKTLSVKISLKTNEVSIPDIRARTRTVIHILQKMT